MHTVALAGGGVTGFPSIKRLLIEPSPDKGRARVGLNYGEDVENQLAFNLNNFINSF